MPPSPSSKIRYLSGYTLLSRFSKQCGASKPHLLRATQLRKHLATKCVHLELNDNNLKDLAGFMGHHVNVHVNHYRRDIAERDIPLFLKFLKASTKIDDDKLKNVTMETLNSIANSHVEDMDETCGVSLESNTSGHRTLTKKKTKTITTRTTWSAVEKKIVNKRFPEYVCIFQKSYALLGQTFSKFKKKGSFLRPTFFGTFFCQKYGKNSAATQ